MCIDDIVVTPETDIVGNATYVLKKELATLVRGEQLRITMDMTNVTMIDSLGIGVLVATRNLVRQTNGEFQIINLSKDLIRLFSDMQIIEFLNAS